MTSPAKVEANRRNGARSRGPKTNAGKTRSSLNALRHGLAVPLLDGQHLPPEVEALARYLCGPNPEPELWHAALGVAAAECDLKRIRDAKVMAVRASESQVKAEDALNPDDEMGIVLDRTIAGKWSPPKRTTEEITALAMAGAFLELNAMDRYENRALSRKKRALRAFSDLGGGNADTTTGADHPRRGSPPPASAGEAVEVQRVPPVAEDTSAKRGPLDQVAFQSSICGGAIDREMPNNPPVKDTAANAGAGFRGRDRRDPPGNSLGGSAHPAGSARHTGDERPPPSSEVPKWLGGPEANE